MFGDLALIGASAVAISLAPLSPLTWILVALTFKTWQEQGGFIAWHPTDIKKFFKEAKKIGLYSFYFSLPERRHE